MAHKRSAYKELRKAKKRHFRNSAIKSGLKTIMKKFEKLVSEKKSVEAKEFLSTVVSAMDKAASKGIIHKNAASRKASRLTKKVSALSKT